MVRVYGWTVICCVGLRVDFALSSALYTEMKEGILANETDYASKPLRDHLKRVYYTLQLRTQLNRIFRGHSEG